MKVECPFDCVLPSLGWCVTYLEMLCEPSGKSGWTPCGDRGWLSWVCNNIVKFPDTPYATCAWCYLADHPLIWSLTLKDLFWFPPSFSKWFLASIALVSSIASAFSPADQRFNPNWDIVPFFTIFLVMPPPFNRNDGGTRSPPAMQHRLQNIQDLGLKCSAWKGFGS